MTWVEYIYSGLHLFIKDATVVLNTYGGFADDSE